MFRCICVWLHIPRVAVQLLHGDGDIAQRGGKRNWEAPVSSSEACFLLGQGFPLASYRPEHPPRREQFVLWTFTPVFDKASPAVAGIMDMTTKRDAFPFGVKTSIGPPSWSWPEDAPSKQKLVSVKHFDPQQEFFKRGAHMPLMIFVGAQSDIRRSKAAQRKRAAAADRRGWNWERRQTTQPGRSKGKGKNESKGKGKGKSKGKWTGGKGTQKGAGKP